MSFSTFTSDVASRAWSRLTHAYTRCWSVVRAEVYGV